MPPKLTPDQFQLQEALRYYGLSPYLRFEDPKPDGSLTLYFWDRSVEIDADTVIQSLYLHQDELIPA